MTNNSDLIIYNTDDRQTHLQVTLENETVWLTQKQMAELFQKDVRTINEHIQTIFVTPQPLFSENNCKISQICN